MRVMMRGGATEESGRIAAALVRGGCEIVQAGAADVVLTVGAPPAPGQAALASLGMVGWNGGCVRLSRTELAIFTCLRLSDVPVGREALLRAVWGYRFDPGTNLLAVHISRLRGKLGHGSILHAHGGYRLVDGRPAATVPLAPTLAGPAKEETDEDHADRRDHGDAARRSRGAAHRRHGAGL